MAKKTVKFVNAANPERAEAMFRKRISNASGTHADSRFKRARTRSAQKNLAIKSF